MKNISEVLSDRIRSIGIAGHVNPDGDCVGSCTALWQYLRNMDHFEKVDLYLEESPPETAFLQGVSSSMQEIGEEYTYDLFITCDVSDYSRIGVAQRLFDLAAYTVCIDHHVSNPGFADVNHIEPDSSSCSEVLAGLFDPEKVDLHIAESLYTGIINDCGVFQFKNTSPGTMRTAAWLMEKGIDFNRIIDESFNNRSLIKNKVLGYCLLKSKSVLGGKCIISSITLEEMASLNASQKDLDIVVNQLKYTEGSDSAVFAYETEPGVFKVSLRSSDNLDVSVTAKVFEGGGHFRAAGCTLRGSVDEVLARIVEEIRKRLGK